jgi:quercetin dioxygenase-like cupin family protein
MTKERPVSNTRTLVFALLGLMTPSMVQAAEFTPLISKDLADIPGREVLMFTVEKAPGSSDPTYQLYSTLHSRTYAHGFIYVLEGAMKMQMGGKEVTLTQGQTWYEGPHDVHSIGQNASSTKPVKFLVFLVKAKHAP